MTAPLIGEENTIKNGVLVGKEQYLFLYDGNHKKFDLLTGITKPTEASIINFKQNIEKRQLFCAQRNIVFYHIVFPCKPIVCFDKLPNQYANRVSSIFSTYYEEALNQTNHKYIHYPISELLDAKRTAKIFRTLDTHMTSFGNVVVANYLLKNWVNA